MVVLLTILGTIFLIVSAILVRSTKVENGEYCNCDSDSNTYDIMLCRLCVCTIYDRIYEISN